MELEAAAFPVEYGNPDDIGREQVAGELDTLEVQAERRRQRVGEHGLAHPGDVLDEQVAAREQARDRQPDLAVLTEYDAADLDDDFLDLLRGHAPVNPSLPVQCPFYVTRDSTVLARACGPRHPAVTFAAVRRIPGGFRPRGGVA